MSKPIYEWSSGIKYLSKLTSTGLTEWLQAFLVDHNPDPLDIDFYYTTPSTVVCQLYEDDNATTLRASLRQCVGVMIDEWSVAKHPPELLAELLSVAGELRFTECLDRVLALAKDETVRSQFQDSMDLHFHLLRVLIGFQKCFDVDVLLERDFDDPRYAPILFRAAWSRTKDGWLQSIRLLPRFFALFEKDSRVDLHGTLRDFLEHLKLQLFTLTLNVVVWHLGTRHYFLFLQVLSEIGVLVRPSSLHGFEILWNVGNGPHIRNVPTPFIDMSPRRRSLLDADPRSTESDTLLLPDVFRELSTQVPPTGHPDTEPFKQISLKWHRLLRNKYVEHHADASRRIRALMTQEAVAQAH